MWSVELKCFNYIENICKIRIICLMLVDNVLCVSSSFREHTCIQYFKSNHNAILEDIYCSNPI